MTLELSTEALFPSRLHKHSEDKSVYTPAAFFQSEFSPPLSDFRANTNMQLMVCGEVSMLQSSAKSLTKKKRKKKVGGLHVEVLLGVLYVPLDFSVYVKVKLLGHG